MKAIVTKTADGKISVRAQHHLRNETLIGRHNHIKAGDNIEVRRIYIDASLHSFLQLFLYT